jgi:endonuclease G
VQWRLLFLLLFITGCATAPSTSRKNEKPIAAESSAAPATSSSTSPATTPTTPPLQSREAPTAHKEKSPYHLVLLDHKVYRAYYDTSIRSSRYVIYTALAENMRFKVARRKDKFRADPLLIEKGLPYVSPKEYAHSGYDRGHLAPSNDFTYDQSANDETFVMSNMSPQKGKLNQQAWRYLEARVHRWICGEEKVTVITGPIFSEHPETLKDGLPIPAQYFKIVIDETPPKKVIAFVYNQNDSQDVMAARVATVSDIEKKTKINFSGELPQEILRALRRPTNFEEWKEKDCN